MFGTAIKGVLVSTVGIVTRLLGGWSRYRISVGA